MDNKRALISGIFVIVGIFLIFYGLSRDCNVGTITQTVGEVTATIEQPEMMQRMICLSTDPLSIIPLLIGSAGIFPGIAGLYKIVTEKEEE